MRHCARYCRKWCQTCGGHVLTDHPVWGLVDVYAATVPAFPFQPAVHVNYSEPVLRMTDGLPKLKDVPAEFGAPASPWRNDPGCGRGAGNTERAARH